MFTVPSALPIYLSELISTLLLDCVSINFTGFIVIKNEYWGCLLSLALNFKTFQNTGPFKEVLLRTEEIRQLKEACTVQENASEIPL